eukprot:1086935-Heterocapsa_arctica.AAC.1
MAVKSLLTRSYVHACRAFFQESPVEQELRRLQAPIAKLAEGRGRRVSGFNLYFAAMLSKLKPRLKQQ